MYKHCRNRKRTKIQPDTRSHSIAPTPTSRPSLMMTINPLGARDVCRMQMYASKLIKIEPVTANRLYTVGKKAKVSIQMCRPRAPFDWRSALNHPIKSY